MNSFMPIEATMLWRRLDLPGHDACRLERGRDGWRIAGCAAFDHAEGPAALDYAVECDRAWNTIAGRIRGSVGDRTVDATIRREASGWIMNGRPMAGLERLTDLDLSFTPSTNLLQIKKFPASGGDPIPFPVAWFDLDAGTLSELPQIYQRRAEREFWYQAPSVGYEALLRLGPSGFVSQYPGLWEAVARSA